MIFVFKTNIEINMNYKKMKNIEVSIVKGMMEQ